MGVASLALVVWSRHLAQMDDAPNCWSWRRALSEEAVLSDDLKRAVSIVAVKQETVGGLMDRDGDVGGLVKTKIER